MKTTPTLALAVASALVLAAAPAQAEGVAAAGPCDELVAYLHEALTDQAPTPLRELVDRRWERTLEDSLRSSLPMDPPAYTTRVTPTCRDAIRRGAAPAAVSAARGWAQRSERGWIDRGRIVLCTMQDPASLGEVAAWMADAHHAEARAVCASELATWPGAERHRRAILAGAVRERDAWPARWEIDPAIVAAANVMGTRDLRDLLAPVLATAHAQQAVGYDRLRDGVCTNDGRMSEARARVCSTLPVEAEDEWWGAELWKRRLATGVATAVYASVLTAAFVDRDHEAGRAIATGAGVPLGAVCGMTLASLVAAPKLIPSLKSGSGFARTNILAASLVAGGAIAGGVIGGLVAHWRAASPGAHGPVTAVALAPVYLTVVAALNFD